MSLRCIFVYALAAVACFADDAADNAPDNVMSTDRPGYGESTDIVPLGVFQMEAGVTADNTSFEGAHTHSLTGPGTLVRMAATPWMELRGSTNGIQYERDSTPHSATESHAGFADVTFGAKFPLAREAGHRPAVSIIAELTFPTGSGGFSDGGYNPEIELIWAKSLPRGFGVSGNLNLWWVPGDTGGVPGHAQSMSFGHALPGKLQGYWEVYHVAPTPGADAPSWNTDAGFSRMLGSNAQVDLEAGHSLLARVSDWFVAGGFSFRVFVKRH